MLFFALRDHRWAVLTVGELEPSVEELPQVSGFHICSKA